MSAVMSSRYRTRMLVRTTEDSWSARIVSAPVRFLMLAHMPASSTHSSTGWPASSCSPLRYSTVTKLLSVPARISGHPEAHAHLIEKVLRAGRNLVDHHRRRVLAIRVQVPEGQQHRGEHDIGHGVVLVIADDVLD